MIRRNVLRPILDISANWLIIFAAVFLADDFVLWKVFLAVLFIGNRQRALGNLLHDASHRNLSKSSRTNDFLATFFIAPALFNNLALYRKSHMAHHASLGDPLSDPDYIFDSGKKFQSWVGCFLFHLLQPRTWLNSMAGHLLKIKRPSWDLFHLLAWWLTLQTALWICFGPRVCASFFVLWMLSRATFFYLITTFREMSDHFGRPAGSVVSFTRDITIHGFGLKWIIHPHNNGYHLTHHILPSIPYYRLHLAQKEFAKLDFYAGKALHCDGYLFGKTAIVREWKTQVASSTLAPSGHSQAIEGLLNN